MNIDKPSLAYRLRWMLLIVLLLWMLGAYGYALLCDTLGIPLGWLQMLDEQFIGDGKPHWYTVVFLFVVITLTQILFLRPRGNFKLELTEQGRPLTSSVIVAGLIVAVLSLAFVGTLMELMNIWEMIIDVTRNEVIFWTGFFSVLCFFWTLWGFIFFGYWYRGDRYTKLRRMSRWMLTGSLLELMIAGPVQAFIRPNDCYCARGSYMGLTLGVTVAVWAFGPFVFLIFLEKYYRARKLEERKVIRESPTETDQTALPD